jgi:hypothetical protein
MKKGLLTILGATALSTLALAQDANPFVGYSTKWMDSVNQKYAVQLDLTNRTLGLGGLTNAVTDGLWKYSDYDKAKVIQTAVIDGNALKITSKRLITGKDKGENWQDITLQFTNWVGKESDLVKYPHFGVAGVKTDTMVGQFVDMSKKKTISATVDVSADCSIRFDLIDANGNISNSASPKQKIKAGKHDLTWYFNLKTVLDTVTKLESEVSVDTLFNYYGQDSWEVKNGRGSNACGFTALDNAGKEVSVSKFKDGDAIPFDISKVVKIAMIVNENLDGVVGELVTITMTDLVVGDNRNVTAFKPYTATATDNVPFVPANVRKVPFPATFTIYGGTFPTFKDGVTVSEAPVAPASALVVYPNPAKGQITVNEDVKVTTVAGVATGVAGTGVLDISSLVAGTYYVVGTTGTTTLVVE